MGIKTYNPYTQMCIRDSLTSGEDEEAAMNSIERYLSEQ